MKTLIKIVICFGVILNSNAQSIEENLFKITVKENIESTIHLDQKWAVLKDLKMKVSPQFGNLFLTRIEAKKEGINLKDFYNDFDFGFKIGLNYLLENSLNLQALYSLGMLKFNKTDTIKTESYFLKLSIVFVF